MGDRWEIDGYGGGKTAASHRITPQRMIFAFAFRFILDDDNNNNHNNKKPSRSYSFIQFNSIRLHPVRRPPSASASASASASTMHGR